MQRIDSREFSAWQAEYSLAPWGEERLEMAVHELTCLVANSLRGKGDPHCEPPSCLLWFDAGNDQAEPPDEEEVQERAAAVWKKLETALTPDP